MTLLGAVVTSLHRASADRHWFVHHYSATRDAYRLDPLGPRPPQPNVGGVRSKWVPPERLADPTRWAVVRPSPFPAIA
jgi:hypothetical protein